ncbi:MAG: luciferase family protein [Solirubrobacteraceae bacterium]
MTEIPSAGARITGEACSWPGVGAEWGSRGEWSIRLGRSELGHLHGDHAAHFAFPNAVWDELHAAGRITEHPVFPGKRGPAARGIETDADVADVIALMRLNYERIAARVAPDVLFVQDRDGPIG